MSSTNNYYYAINSILENFPKKDIEEKVSLLEINLGKWRVTKQRYFKSESTKKVRMTIEEALVYKTILGLKSVEELLSKNVEDSALPKFKIKS